MLYITKIRENLQCDAVSLVTIRKVVATTNCSGPWWTASTTRRGQENPKHATNGETKDFI